MPGHARGEPPELTLKALGLGLLLACVFGAANAYLGMKAGQTVAATIPAAVIALAVFRTRTMRGSVLEQNIARTAASVGEALVAGAIFTIPAFTMVRTGAGRLWTDLREHYWEASLILLAGGLLGVFFVIALRRPLCVEAGLPWPESVASAEIVRAGERAGAASRRLFGAMGLAAVVELLKSDRGLPLLRESSAGWLEFPRALIRHVDAAQRPLAEVIHRGGLPWSTPSLSPALLGIGFIVGPRVAAVNFAGGVLAWWVLVPTLVFFDPDLPRRLGVGEPVAWDRLAYSIWRSVVRPLAVGAMLVAACWTLSSMRKAILRSLRGLWQARHGSARVVAERTERDLGARWILAGLAVSILSVFGIYLHFTGALAPALAASAIMIVAGFLLSAVGAYLVGLVGSSNQPVSGLTLAALVLAAVVMVAGGQRGPSGVAAVLGVAAVVCCACCVAGSLAQDLKAGHLLGGTPWKMQVIEIVAVTLLSAFLMLPILALDEANRASGGIGGVDLPAPQAGLMAQLAQGIVGGEMAWGLFAAGAALGCVLILAGVRSPMLAAVGMYLPFKTVAAIFAGGLIRWTADRLAERRGARAEAEERGMLIASGLIAGEAILGIGLAVAALRPELPSLARLLTGAEEFAPPGPISALLSAAVFLLLAWVLARPAARSD
ncbi:MAG: oligopeptide transporter, OPT family [Bryobacterales bacterium]|nr:oligopeptide transporter, OPT family [Bryobacterales bacterium]